MSRRVPPLSRPTPYRGISYQVIRGDLHLLYATAIATALAFLVYCGTATYRLHSAELAFSGGDYREAWKLAELELTQNSQSSQAAALAGLSAQYLKARNVTSRYFDRITDDKLQLTKLLGTAEFLLQSGRVTDGEAVLRQILRLNPNQPEALEKLIYLLVLEGRTWEAQSLIPLILKTGRVDLNHLIVLGSNKTELDPNNGFTAACLAVMPGDPLPLLPRARHELQRQLTGAARITLSGICDKRPEISEAQAMLGIILVETSNDDDFLKWHQRLPKNAEEHPAIWFCRGLWSVKTGQQQAATRCFAETISRQPNHIAANYQLSQSLSRLSQSRQAITYGDRAQHLARLESLVGEIKVGWTTDLARQIVGVLEKLERYWEAAAWCHVSRCRNEDGQWAVQTLQRLSPILLATEGNSGFVTDISELTKYPLPNLTVRRPFSDSSNADRASTAGPVKFSDEAAAAQLRFTYQNGGTTGDRESMFEFDGGGVAVLDYDRDYWPDIYFTQGGPLPSEANRRTAADELFRNTGAGSFTNVTSLARLGDTAFSQGVTVGDFNNDGFPDLYVANVGPNSFYVNNGDGTFTDVSHDAGTMGDEWTSSCVLTDVNQDGNPDLFVVNYLAGEELYSRTCLKSSPQRCYPAQYPAAADRLYLNRGDGQFDDITKEAGIEDHDGRGLGVIAADFRGDHRISLFVGNDMSRNFLFENQTGGNGVIPRFVDVALLQGVAVDSRGIPKAAMGVAAEDADGDGLLDLFITNFYRESNNLYLQQPDHSFRDATHAANLSESGFHMLGWGAQFIDGELDGYPDLIVTNGHVHQPSDVTVPHRMPAQYFRNCGRAKFEEQSPETLGSFFAVRQLGRALASLDWNRDGLEEACISNLDTPAALLLNKTSNRGHHLVVHLVGTTSSRDAIGTSVVVTTNGHQRTRQLIAGNGYQASNQRSLHFGLGLATEVERIEVHWPCGKVDSLRNLPINCEVVVVEGSKRVTIITPDR